MRLILQELEDEHQALERDFATKIIAEEQQFNNLLAKKAALVAQEQREIEYLRQQSQQRIEEEKVTFQLIGCNQISETTRRGTREDDCKYEDTTKSILVEKVTRVARAAKTTRPTPGVF